jgi:excinuclease ABC subunit C
MALANARQAATGKATAAATLGEQFAALARVLRLPDPPEHVECFDISHTAGGETVASCVVFGPDGPLKQYYRRFNVRDVTPGDDYAALGQVIQRRYARPGNGEPAMPDLILIDGGRGQLARAVAVLQELQLGDAAVIAVSKGPGRRPGREQIHQPGRRTPLRLPPDSGALHLIQQIRDEAHRFAITGHRLRRMRKRTQSALELIPGLGPRRRRALLTHLGGLHGVTRASIDDLARVPGISRTLAGRIYDHFHEPAAP